MTVPDNDGCPWPVDTACLTDAWETDFDEATQIRAIALASNTLRRLCAFRVGGCPVFVRPCIQQCVNGFGFSLYQYGTPFIPLNWNGAWTNIWCGCVGPCRHDPNVAVKLPPPVYDVTEVKVDGSIVDPSNYWVSDNHLIGLDGQTWPRTQNLDLPDTETGTFSVTYLDSAPVDGMGAYACGKLAMQYAKACSGSGKCDLPSQVTSVVRQGVSYSIPAGSFPNGETGLREVDAFIALWNPSHRKQKPRVYSP